MWPAFIVIALGAAVTGIVVYVVVMRPMRTTSQLTQIIATVGVLLIIQSVAVLEWSGTAITVSQYLPSSLYVVGGIYVTLV